MRSLISCGNPKVDADSEEMSDLPLNEQEISFIRHAMGKIQRKERTIRMGFTLALAAGLLVIVAKGSWTNLLMGMVAALVLYTIALKLIAVYFKRGSAVSLRIGGEELIDPLNEKLLSPVEKDELSSNTNLTSKRYKHNALKLGRDILLLDKYIMFALHDHENRSRA